MSSGKGVFKQLEIANKKVYSSFNIDTFKSELFADKDWECKKLRLATNAKYYQIEKGRFSSEELKSLLSMIESSDIESIQLANDIISTKLK